MKRVIKIINSSLIYITDWFSTLLDLAGLKHRIPAAVDSLSIKRTLLRGTRSRSSSRSIRRTSRRTSSRTSSRRTSSSRTRSRRRRRREIILNLDREEDQGLWSAAILRGGYKLIWGQARLLKLKVTTTTLKHLDKIQQVCRKDA